MLARRGILPLVADLLLRVSLPRVTMVLVAALLVVAAAPFVSTAPTYFGEPNPGLDPVTARRVTIGRELFVKLWDDGNGAKRNRSCLSCHEVPMPGGSGIHTSSFVRAEIDEAISSGFRIVETTTRNEASGPPLNLKPPALFGLGLVENVHCSGRCSAGVLGYRGRLKTIDQFVSLAFETELGVKVKLHPNPAKNEISPEQIGMVAEFIRYLAPPPEETNPAEQNGKNIFESTGCAACHIQEQKTRSASPAALRRVSFQPLSDFVVHRVRRDRNYGVRTAPLWGLAYTGPPYLHDASANTLDEAIIAHQGEAAGVTKRYQSLSAADRERLLRFLKSR